MSELILVTKHKSSNKVREKKDFKTATDNLHKERVYPDKFIRAVENQAWNFSR